jgi:hypothetical protein
MYVITQNCDLDGVIGVSTLLEGVTLITLKACDTIHVRTRNSTVIAIHPLESDETTRD